MTKHSYTWGHLYSCLLGFKTVLCLLSLRYQGLNPTGQLTRPGQAGSENRSSALPGFA